MENTNVTEQSTNEIMPMAASGETNFASLPEKTTPASGDMFLMEDSEDTKKINYDKLADAILNKLTSKTYSGLETTAKNFVTAINELNSKSARVYKSPTSLNLPVLKITPLKQTGEFLSFVNRNGRKDIYVFSNSQTINIDAETVYGTDYTVKNDESSIYIVVNASTVNFVFASVECVVTSVESAPE